MSVAGFDHHLFKIGVGRLVQSYVCGEVRISAALQIATSLVCLIMSDNVYNPAAGLHTNGRNILPQLGILAGLLCFLALRHSLQLEAATALIRASRSSFNECLVKQLLDGMCDATIKLDECKRVCGGGARLATSLLLHDTSENALNGKAFASMLSPLDVTRFEDHINSKVRLRDANEPAFPLHVHLLDSLGNRVPTELLFSFMYDNALDVAFYMVGVMFEDRAAVMQEVAEHPKSASNIKNRGAPSNDSFSSHSADSFGCMDVKFSCTLDGSITHRSLDFERLVDLQARDPANTAGQPHLSHFVCDANHMLEWMNAELTGIAHQETYGPAATLCGPQGDNMNAMFAVQFPDLSGQASQTRERIEITVQMVAEETTLSGKKKLRGKLPATRLQKLGSRTPIVWPGDIPVVTWPDDVALGKPSFPLSL